MLLIQISYYLLSHSDRPRPAKGRFPLIMLDTLYMFETSCVYISMKIVAAAASRLPTLQRCVYGWVAAVCF